MSETDRIKELFLYDIIVAIAKIKYIANKFDNPEDLKYDFLHWDSIIREFEAVLNIAKNNLEWLENMIYERIKQIEPTLKEELKKEMIEENKNLDFVKKALDKIQ